MNKCLGGVGAPGSLLRGRAGRWSVDKKQAINRMKTGRHLPPGPPHVPVFPGQFPNPLPLPMASLHMPEKMTDRLLLHEKNNQKTETQGGYKNTTKLSMAC